MNNKQIFDTIKNYAKDYIFLAGSCKVYEIDGEFKITERMDDPTKYLPIMSDYDPTIGEAMESLGSVEVDKEGFYYFEVLVKRNVREDLTFFSTVEHIEWDYISTIQQEEAFQRKQKQFWEDWNNRNGMNEALF